MSPCGLSSPIPHSAKARSWIYGSARPSPIFTAYNQRRPHVAPRGDHEAIVLYHHHWCFIAGPGSQPTDSGRASCRFLHSYSRGGASDTLTVRRIKKEGNGPGYADGSAPARQFQDLDVSHLQTLHLPPHLSATTHVVPRGGFQNFLFFLRL